MFIRYSPLPSPRYRHFNTTLVIVYQYKKPGRLSVKEDFNTTLVIVYLSTQSIWDLWVHYFNTTLVIVYPDGRMCRSRSNAHFNTTLVIVYRFRSTEEPLQGSYFNTTLVIVYRSRRFHGFFIFFDFNTTLVIVYETRNHGFMRSVRPRRQISDKLPASNRVLQLLYPMLLRHARLPAGPIHYKSSMSVILTTVLRGSSFSSITSKQ